MIIMASPMTVLSRLTCPLTRKICSFMRATDRFIPIPTSNHFFETNRSPAWVRHFHSTSTCSDLMEFFDTKDNWGEPHVRVGRPWKKDELRLKNNTDIHKLWYVLLKERNMLMTMETEYKRQGELFPNPERIDKVEESMENILDIVSERNRAYNLLETGETGEPGRRWVVNELGVGYWRKCKESFIPLHMNRNFARKAAAGGPWQNKFLKLAREQRLQERSRERRREYKQKQTLQKHFNLDEVD